MLGDRRRVRPALAARRAASTSSRRAATATLIAAAELGDARALAAGLLAVDNRQIPSALGRLHPTRSTPYVLIIIAAVHRRRADRRRRTSTSSSASTRSARCSALTIAHLSIVALRYREPDRDRPYRMPLSVRFGGGDLPLPAVLGARAVGSAPGSASSSPTRARATSASAGWPAASLLYVVYRTHAGQAAAQARHGARGARCARERDASRVRLDPRADPRHAARRRHHPDGRAAGRRGGRRLRGRGAARRSRRCGSSRCRWRCRSTRALPEAQLKRARAALRARQGGGGGVRGRRGRDGDRARPPRRAGDRRRGAAARRRGDRAGRRGAVADPRRRAARRPRRAAATTSSARSRSTCVSKAPCRVILDRAAARDRDPQAGPREAPAATVRPAQTD